MENVHSSEGQLIHLHFNFDIFRTKTTKLKPGEPQTILIIQGFLKTD